MSEVMRWSLENRSRGIKIPIGRYARNTPTLLDYVTSIVRSYSDIDYSEWVLWAGQTNYFYTPICATEKGTVWAWMHGDREVC